MIILSSCVSVNTNVQVCFTKSKCLSAEQLEFLPQDCQTSDVAHVRLMNILTENRLNVLGLLKQRG